MRREKLKYREPVMCVLTYDENEVFTLTTSTEYDPNQWESGNIPSIGDFLDRQ